MYRTVYILTRYYAHRNHQSDEFVKEWGFRPTLDHAIVESEGRKIVFIHGCKERFSADYTSTFIPNITNEISALHGNTTHPKAFLCHTDRLVSPESFADFHFAREYSVGDAPEDWSKLEQLKGTFDKRSLKVVKPENFAATFDTIWQHFQPDKRLREAIEKAHDAFEMVQSATSNALNETDQIDNYLVIWNTSSGEWFKKEFLNYIGQGNHRPKQITLITSYSDFEAIDWSNNWLKVFVLSELYWTNKDHEGLSLIFDILKVKEDNQPLEIVICSVLARKELYGRVKDRNKMIVKSFPHLHLTQSLNFTILEQMYVSNRKWAYKRAELLNEEEILAALIHHLNRVQAGGKDFTNKTKAFYVYLSNFRWLLSGETLAEVAILKSLLGIEAIDVTELKDCIQKLKSALQKDIDNRAKPIVPTPSQAKLMVVEDDASYLTQLVDLFKPWFSTIVQYSNGWEALKELKNTANQFDALIVDLELLDHDALEGTVQGVDLIDFCEQQARWMALRVVTGLPRNSIPRRLSDFKNDRIILKQNSENTEGVFVLPHFDQHEFMGHLSKEITNLSFWHKMNGITGPSNGAFGAKSKHNLTSVFYKFRDNQPDLFKEKIEDVLRQARMSLVHQMPVPYQELTRNLNDTGDWSEFLWYFLVLRLIVISKKDNAEGLIIYINYTHSTGVFFDLGFKLEPEDMRLSNSAVKNWLTTRLGFSIKDMPKDVHKLNTVRLTIDLEEKHLFPHEIKWLQNYSLDSLTLMQDKFSLSFCNTLCTKISYIYHAVKEIETKRQAAYQATHEVVESSQADPIEYSLMEKFTEKSSMDDLHKINLFLEAFKSYKSDNRVSKGFNELITLIDVECSDSDDGILLPQWLDKMIDA